MHNFLTFNENREPISLIFQLIAILKKALLNWWNLFMKSFDLASFISKYGKYRRWKGKDKNLYPSCKTYYEKCKQCGEDYVGETKRNCTTVGKNMITPLINLSQLL